jgi:hypothetical protein
MTNSVKEKEDVIEFFCDEISVCMVVGNTMISCLECSTDYSPRVIEIELNGELIYKQVDGEVILDTTDKCPELKALEFANIGGYTSLVLFNNHQ